MEESQLMEASTIEWDGMEELMEASTIEWDAGMDSEESMDDDDDEDDHCNNESDGFSASRSNRLQAFLHCFPITIIIYTCSLIQRWRGGRRGGGRRRGRHCDEDQTDEEGREGAEEERSGLVDGR